MSEPQSKTLSLNIENFSLSGISVGNIFKPESISSQLDSYEYFCHYPNLGIEVLFDNTSKSVAYIKVIFSSEATTGISNLFPDIELRNELIPFQGNFNFSEITFLNCCGNIEELVSYFKSNNLIVKITELNNDITQLIVTNKTNQTVLINLMGKKLFSLELS